jgi:hypothetical protein
MKLYPQSKTLILGASIAAAFFFASSVQASGSMPSPSRVPSSSSNSQTSNTNSYDQGKMVYMEKISCSTCPVSAGVNDAAGAKALMMRVDANEFSLSKNQKRDLKKFLKRRFEVQ